MTGLNTLDRDDLLRLLEGLNNRIFILERLFQGVPIGTARIANASITDAKIDSLSVDKLTSGILSVIADIGDTGNAGYTRLNGPDNNIIIAEDVVGSPLPRILIGDDGN